MGCEVKQDSAADVELMINGSDVELNCFVKNFIAETFVGMVKSLRGVGEVETLQLKITKK